MSTRTLTLEIDDDKYVAVLRAIANALDHEDQYKGEPEPTRATRRAWTGPDAVADATGTLNTTTTYAWPILTALMSTSEHAATMAELTGPTGLDVNFIRAYHRLFGKQAWRNGKRANPIQTRRDSNGDVVMHMNPNAIAAFSAALGAIKKGQS